MSRTRTLFLTLSALALGTAAAAAPTAPAGAAPSAPAEAKSITPAEAAELAPAAKQPVYGPIHSKDPVVRAEIKRLYLERNRLVDETRAHVVELGESLKAETDPDLRLEIGRDIAQVKADLELRAVELGLEIARLNENETRAAEFEKALDQLRNPEKYRPAPVDPSVQRERMRQMGLDDGGAR